MSENIEDKADPGISGNIGEGEETEVVDYSSTDVTGNQSHIPEAEETLQEVDTRNICSRTPEIQQLLIEMLDITRCRDITSEELLRVRSLELDRIPLKVGDLDGFKNLTSLTLLTREVSEGLFDDLESLEHMELVLETPPSTGLFKSLSALRQLELRIEAQADVVALPLKGMFEGLSKLETLDLGVRNSASNYAVALLNGSLTGMPKLQQLKISNVSRVESDTFSELPALRTVILEAINLPDHLTKPSVPPDVFVGNPDLGSVYLSGFQEISRLEFNSLSVVCRMQSNMDLRYGVEFDVVVEDKVVEVVDYDWDEEILECTLRVAPEGSESWQEVKVDVPPLPSPRRN